MARDPGHGIGFGGALQLTFIILKLCEVINWSWWLVMLPSLLVVSLIVFVLGGFFIVTFLQEIARQRRNKRRDHGKN